MDKSKRVTDRVGSSGWGYTPQRMEVVATSLAGKVAYRLLGQNIFVPTTVWLCPRQLEAKVEKYRKRRQWLVGPGLTPQVALLPAWDESEEREPSISGHELTENEETTVNHPIHVSPDLQIQPAV
ncbi:hypothetical protein GCM10027299_09240 [Larkinella ripae]